MKTSMAWVASQAAATIVLTLSAISCAGKPARPTPHEPPAATAPRDVPGTAAPQALAPEAAPPHVAPSEGPAILLVRTEPATVELNRDLEPIQPVQVLADVKDFRHALTGVRLRFTNVPLEIPMQYDDYDDTWKAEISTHQLQRLAVSGRTVIYEAIVLASNDVGEESRSDQNAQVAVKAPNLTSTQPKAD